MEQDRGLPLPKFGEWDVNNPATAEGFTVIFNKARDEKKTMPGNDVPNAASHAGKNEGGLKPDPNYDYPRRTKLWFCCG